MYQISTCSDDCLPASVTRSADYQPVTCAIIAWHQH